MRFFEDDRDSAMAELLRRAYARTVDLDTAARHLWSIDSAAKAGRRSQRAHRARRVMVAVMASLMLGVTSGVAIAASSHTLPGDALYSVKRGAEHARLVLAVRPEADARVYLSIARTRWAEAQRAGEERPRVVPGLLKDTFAALDAAEARGGATAELALALRTQVAASSAELALGSNRSATEGQASGRPGEDGQDVAASPLPPSREPADDAAGSGASDPATTTGTADALASDGQDHRGGDGAPAGASPAPAPAPADAAAPPPETGPAPPPPPEREGLPPSGHPPGDAGPAHPAGEPAVTGGPEEGTGEAELAEPEPALSQPEPVTLGDPAADQASPSAPGWGRPRP